MDDAEHDQENEESKHVTENDVWSVGVFEGAGDTSGYIDVIDICDSPARKTTREEIVSIATDVG